MHQRRIFVALILGLLLSVLVTSCGDDVVEQGTTAPPSGDTSVPVTSTPTNPGSVPPAGSGQAQPIRSRTDLVDARPIDPESVTRDPSNDKRLLVRFWGGVEPCFGVEVRVVESATDVKITVLGGVPPEGRDRACIALAKLYEASVDLKIPLGSRTIVVAK